MRVKMSKQSPPAPTTSAVGPCPTVIQIVGRPGTGSLPSTIAPPSPPSPFFMGDCSKFFCQYCSFQSLQKASRYTKSVATKYSYYISVSFRFSLWLANTLTISTYLEVCVVKVFVIATAFQGFACIVKYCPFMRSFGIHNLSSFGKL